MIWRENRIGFPAPSGSGAEIDKAISELTALLGRHPTEGEVAEKLGITKERYQKDIAGIALSSILSLDMLMDAREADDFRVEVPSRDAETQPEKALETQELQQILAEGIQMLSRNEQIVLSLYYEKEPAYEGDCPSHGPQQSENFSDTRPGHSKAERSHGAVFSWDQYSHKERRESEMFKGFYNLTSSMLTHQQNLNVIANNMVNISTAGYKQDRYTASTFDDVMYSRMGNKHNTGQEIGRQSYIRAASQIYTDYTQGTLEPTGVALDFAIHGDGFFAVQDPDGGIAYTRMGNFSLDDAGYLCLPGYGQVLNPELQPIYLGTDQIYGGNQGTIYYDEGGLIGQLGVFLFEDTGALEHNGEGLFVGAQGTAAQDAEVLNGYLERSNTDIVKQMTEMITYQRALQSAAQVSKMYDQLMTKATTEIGRM